MNYVWYSPKTGAPIVSIADYGITFNSGAIEMMGKPEYVMLGYDEENNTIGVKPCEEKNENKIEFSKKLRNNYVRISNKDFIRFLKSKIKKDIQIGSKAKRFVARWDKEEKMLYVEVNNQIDKKKKHEEERGIL